MSDDEEYFDDDDIFWIEEAEPGIADDLAAGTTYDPIFMEDPSIEVEDFYSDWDELSDDYYDDDPTAVRRQRVLSGEIAKQSNDADSPKKRNQTNGKTHKRAQKSKLTPNAASFQSVIWKNPNHEKEDVKLHEPDDGEKVALLKNWREVFKNSRPSIGGRSHMRKQRAAGSLNSNEGGDDDMEDGSDHTSGMSSLDNLRETDIDSGNVSNTTPGRTPSPPNVHTNKAAKPSRLADSNMTEPDLVRIDESTTHNGEDTKESKATPSPAKSRKRKAPDSVDEQPNGGPEDTKTRSKRIASKKVGEEQKPVRASSPVRRSTRQSKK